MLATNVVDGIALSLFRLQLIGIRYIMVASLVPGTCMPYNTMWVNNSNACITNDTISSETILNNALLEDRVNLLNKGLHGADIIIVNMTKAFQELFHNGEKYGEITFTKTWDVCHSNFNIIESIPGMWYIMRCCSSLVVYISSQNASDRSFNVDGVVLLHTLHSLTSFHCYLNI